MDEKLFIRSRIKSFFLIERVFIVGRGVFWGMLSPKPPGKEMISLHPHELGCVLKYWL